MKAHELLQAVFSEIATEAKQNPDFGERILRQLQKVAAKPHKRRPHAGRRAPGVIDPFARFREGEETLRNELEKLDVEQLKDIIAEHGMDSAKLAMRWKSRERLTDLIVKTVASRSRKGDAFRSRPDNVDEEDDAGGTKPEAPSEGPT